MGDSAGHDRGLLWSRKPFLLISFGMSGCRYPQLRPSAWIAIHNITAWLLWRICIEEWCYNWLLFSCYTYKAYTCLIRNLLQQMPRLDYKYFIRSTGCQKVTVLPPSSLQQNNALAFAEYRTRLSPHRVGTTRVQSWLSRGHFQHKLFQKIVSPYADISENKGGCDER